VCQGLVASLRRIELRGGRLARHDACGGGGASLHDHRRSCTALDSFHASMRWKGLSPGISGRRDGCSCTRGNRAPTAWLAHAARCRRYEVGRGGHQLESWSQCRRQSVCLVERRRIMPASRSAWPPSSLERSSLGRKLPPLLRDATSRRGRRRVVHSRAWGPRGFGLWGRAGPAGWGTERTVSPARARGRMSASSRPRPRSHTTPHRRRQTGCGALPAALWRHRPGPPRASLAARAGVACASRTRCARAQRACAAFARTRTRRARRCRAYGAAGYRRRVRFPSRGALLGC
jgi:hypothetical protein